MVVFLYCYYYCTVVAIGVIATSIRDHVYALYFFLSFVSLLHCAARQWNMVYSIPGRHWPPSRLSYSALIQDSMNGLDGCAGVALVVLMATAAGGAGPLEFPREADGFACRPS